MNPGISAELKPNTRSRNIRLKKVHSAHMKSMIPLAMLASTLHEARSREKKEWKVDLDACVQYAVDAIAVLSYSNLLLNVRRRESIRSDLHPSYRPLCSKQVPITNYLFGDDLQKSMREIKEVNQVSRDLGHKITAGYGQRNRYSRNKDFHEPKKAFLYKKRQHHDQHRRRKDADK